jgi:hypothetical protein
VLKRLKLLQQLRQRTRTCHPPRPSSSSLYHTHTHTHTHVSRSVRGEGRWSQRERNCGVVACKISTRRVLRMRACSHACQCLRPSFFC